MFVDVFRHADYNPRELQTLKKGIMAGSSCPPPLCDRLVKELGMYDFGIGYGSTELSPLTTFSRLSEPPMERINSVGYAFYHTEVCVVDKNGQVVERGEKGEVCSRGANVMKGYWNDEKETKQSIDQDGWYHTGDVGIMHSNGSLEICGRITDGIIRGGENIYPAEVEAYLFKHPDISTVQELTVYYGRLQTRTV
ncbi:unnamed protein product [Bursaphelenchus okinawaensis]|uniref:Medium-chain acyl-CoA ligase ACSF2, mitochondrial n=1 Tax=Bursaphelenchus okinawaensis TaxID=465554 RepID=A0A811K492_9BILA|nr:unnamed protein product [Bursaphelenchus okinawaensis]CAG9092053.1 unnamed protein product [Bursaphelenchus okinawaensis]